MKQLVKKHMTPRSIVLMTGVLAILGGLTLMTTSYLASNQSAFLNEGAIEAKQNQIPPDVALWSKSQQNVLGAINPEHAATLPAQVHVPILMFHYVEYVKDKRDTIRQSLDTTPYTLDAQVKTLKDAGYTFMTASDLAAVMDGSIDLPPKPIVLTFDDGYRDFYTDAYPILKKYHAKATAYIISGFLGYPNNMTADQVKQIAADGLVEIGAHTVHHAWLKGLPLQKLVSEIVQSKTTLENLIHQPVVSFAYPYGAFDVAAVTAVSQAGFTTAASTVPGIDQLQAHRFFLYRLRAGGRTGQNLLSFLANVKDNQVSYSYPPQQVYH